MPVRLEDRVLTLDGGIDSAQLERVLKAIDSHNRLRILRYLASRVASVNDIALALDLPASTTALHVDTLEAAGLIRTELEPASRGLRKICSRNFDRIILDLPYEAPPEQAIELTMPIGAFVDAQVLPTCGIATETRIIGLFDDPRSFYEPDRIHAQLIWFSRGSIEYRFPKNGDEFLQWALKLTTDENGKHPTEDGFNPDKIKVWAIHNSWQRFTMPSTFWQFGGGIISDDSKKSLLDSDATIAATQYWYDLMYKHFVCPPAVPGTAGGGDLYKTNSLAFWWDGSWSLNFFKDNPDAAKVTKAARLNSLAPDGKQAAKIASHQLVVPVGVEGDKLERAKDLILWLSKNDKLWAQSGQVPARLDAQKDPDVQNIWSVKAFAEEFTSIGRPDVPHIAATEIQTTWEAAVSGALAKTSPIKDALTEGSKAIQAILDRS